MKKIISLVTAIFITLSLISCKDSDDGDDGVRSSSELYSVYLEGNCCFEMPLYFLDDVNDLPYIVVNDGADILRFLYEAFSGSVDFTVLKEGSNFTLVRKNDVYGADIPVTIDFEKDLIRFQDYDLFAMRPECATIMDVTSRTYVDENNNPFLIQKRPSKYLPRFGEPLEINLKSYGIDLPVVDGEYLIPLQTFSDIFIAPVFLYNFYFNGNCLVFTGDLSEKGNETDRKLYYEGEHGERSPELTKFGYGELCMMLDNLYGLKDHKEISSFDTLFQTVGSSSIESRSIVQEQSLKSYLLGSSVFNADKAIYTLIGSFLDDNHCKWYNFSYLTGEHEGFKPDGAARERLDEYEKQYKAARNAFYPDGIPAYEEIGDTAFITFDIFEMDSELWSKPSGYYTTPLSEFPEKDIFGLIMKAHDQITRENSPIKNVVIDLSVNIGGAADLAVYIISWFLGEYDMSIKNTMSGAVSTTFYRCDANRDHKFDEKDTLGDRKLFCITSPVSFSCGNLVPSAFKESEKVTLIGKTSAGGACVVQPVSSAWGTSFRISGPMCLVSMKNGAYYDIDQGAEPDYTLRSPESYYNRSELVNFINSIK